MFLVEDDSGLYQGCTSGNYRRESKHVLEVEPTSLSEGSQGWMREREELRMIFRVLA